jgi:hypothetical protein
MTLVEPIDEGDVIVSYEFVSVVRINIGLVSREILFPFDEEHLLERCLHDEWDFRTPTVAIFCL